MILNRLLILLICIGLPIVLWTQINVGSKIYAERGPGIIDDFDLERLKGTITLFVYSEGDDPDELAEMIQEFWTITEIEFIPLDEYIFNEYGDEYSFITIQAHQNTTYKNEVNTHLYLLFWMRGDEEQIVFSRVELHVDHETIKYIDEHFGNYKDAMRYAYEKAIIYNWNRVYIKNSLQIIQSYLSTNDKLFMFDKAAAYPGIENLMQDTLYIPDYTLIKIEEGSGEELGKHTVEELFKKYNYPFKIVNSDELYKLASNSNNPIYYFSYIKSGQIMFINIIDALSGNVYFADFDYPSSNLNAKDFKLISSAIKRM